MQVEIQSPKALHDSHVEILKEIAMFTHYEPWRKETKAKKQQRLFAPESLALFWLPVILKDGQLNTFAIV